MNLEIDNLTPDQIDAIKTQVAEYEKENENQKPKDVIDCEYGWVIYAGEVTRAGMYYSDFVYKISHIGLYRDTKEEAEKLLRKMKIERRLRQWAKMCKEKVDWSNSKQYKFYMLVEDNYVKIDWLSDRKESSIYFTDKSILKRAIEDIGERNLIDNYFVEV